jgi:putative phosphoribosyl transferase
MKYVNRQDAGKRLGKVLRHKRGSGVIVLALPRGGVIVAAEVAKEINAPLGLVLVRKIGLIFLNMLLEQSQRGKNRYMTKANL